MKAHRHQQIVSLLVQTQSMTTDELAAALAVSKETVRRDLSELQRQGKIQRSHGCARAIRRDNHSNESPFQARLKSHYVRKADIARHALTWIDEGMTLALDASSTCWLLARQLPDIAITVFTNSHLACVELAKREHITVMSSGGKLMREFGYYVNPALVSQLKDQEIDLFIFSCEGIDNRGVMWDSSTHNANYKSLLLKRASQSLLLLDKSKFNRSSEARIGLIDEVTHLISDVEPEPIL
ncbi:L-fucose operon activator [Enterobacteriaceae bacterium RIT691]|nr:L-fucose operon activator [Enterobacteriaceae bacterium RIT691]